jgi:SOS-response transcriptional repressor LexA
MARRGRKSMWTPEMLDEMYETMKSFQLANGYMQSVREIKDIMGLKSTSTTLRGLTILEEQGRIESIGRAGPRRLGRGYRIRTWQV